MNISRGCFRLWVVVASIWVASVLWLALVVDARILRPSPDNVLTGGTITWDDDAETPGSTFGANDQPAFDSSASGSRPLDVTGLKPLDESWSAQMGIILAWSLLPPLTVLALGVALSWVAKGFRDSPAAD